MMDFPFHAVNVVTLNHKIYTCKLVSMFVRRQQTKFRFDV